MKKVLIFCLFFISIFCLRASIAYAIDITTCADFEDINLDLTASYVLLNDIDCTAEGNAVMIGSYSGSPFTGTFDGGGYTITVDIDDSSSYIGLFKYVFGGTIQKLKIAGSVVGSNSTVGSLVGAANYGTTIDQVANTASVTSDSSAAGLVGLFVANFSIGPISTISNSYNTGTVRGDYATGGLVGTTNGVINRNFIDKSYSRGLVIGGNGSVGGLVGRNVNSNTITDNFSVSNVGGINSDLSGGLFGNSQSWNPDNTFSNNFWDITRSEQSNCGNYSGSTYTGTSGICDGVDASSSDLDYFKNNDTNAPLDTWDFTTIWETNVNGYPTLQNIIGDEGAVNDEPTAPTVSTTGSSAISEELATMEGNIDDLGGLLAVERGFEYGPDVGYGSTISETGAYEAGAFTLTPVLDCNTTYHFRAFATNVVDTATGADDSFTTGACSDTTDTLYGTDGSGGNPDAPNLYTLDKKTGMILTTIGPVGFNVTGLAFHPDTGVLYGTTSNNDATGGHPKSLITIDPDTGAGTWLGALKDDLNRTILLPDISFNSDGVLYGFTTDNGGTGAADLYTIDLTSCDGGSDTICLATKVGDSGLDPYGNGLAFDSNDSLYFFGNGDDSFFQFDPDTGLSLGETSFSNPSGQSYTIGAAAFDQYDTLFASRRNYNDPPSDLVVVNPTSGYISSLGDTADMLYMDAIAFKFEAIPEPEPEPEPEQPRRSRSGNMPSAVYSTPIVTGPITPLVENNFHFTQNLSQKTINEEVRDLQKFLNTHGFVVSISGVGSLGHETYYFGPKTKAALIRFQEAYRKEILEPLKLIHGTGFFGPNTRRVINELIEKGK